MLTLTLQGVTDLCWLVFGFVAFLISRRLSPNHRDGRPWFLTALVFVLCGSIALSQNIFGTYAYISGRGSAPWNAYLSWAPLLNHARTGAMTAFFVILLWGAASRFSASRKSLLAASAVLGTGTLLGGYFGWREEVLVQEIHYWAIAVYDAGELLVALAALLVLLIGDRIDRLLWLALSVYAFNLALNVIWASALTTIRFPWLWSPEPWQMNSYRVVLAASLVPFAVRRLRFATRGLTVPALLEPISAKRTGLASD